MNRSKRAPRSDGIKTKHKILDATLSVIAENGLKKLTHRDVAKKAEVTLASTTYHFDSLEDLTARAYDRFREVAGHHASSSMQECHVLIANYMNVSHKTKQRRAELVHDLSNSVTDHIVNQSTILKQDRYIEAAFMHHGLKDDNIRPKVLSTRMEFKHQIVTMLEAVGSKTAELDSHHLLSSIYYHETDVLLINDFPKIDEIYKSTYRIFDLIIP